MLNGVDPIIIFNLKKKIPDPTFVGPNKPTIPIVAAVENSIDLPLVPLYLSERITGIYIDSESKTMDIDTTVDTLSSGETPNINQRGIQNSVKIEMIARSSSIGVSLFSAMADLIFPKVTSKEYSITYLHGAITVFQGLIHSFSITQNSENDLYKISLELIKPSALLKAPVPTVLKQTGTVPL